MDQHCWHGFSRISRGTPLTTPHTSNIADSSTNTVHHAFVPARATPPNTATPTHEGGEQVAPTEAVVNDNLSGLSETGKRGLGHRPHRFR